MLTAADMLMGESAASEAAEPKVEAVPRIDRSAMAYLEPRPGKDGLQYAGQCASCSFFVSEAEMAGAITGDRCAVLGSQMSVNDDSSCRFFLSWASGIPCASVTEFYAMELRKGVGAAVSPMEAVYEGNCNTQCVSCKFFSSSQTVPGRGDCGAFDEMNESISGLFALDTSVHPRGGCSLWRTADSEIGYR